MLAHPAPATDPERLERALALFVTPLGPGHYQVDGGAERHYVSLRTEEDRCDCGDRIWREPPRCKHILAVALYRNETDVRLAAIELVQQILAERDAALRALARRRPRLSPSLRTRIAERWGTEEVRLEATDDTTAAHVVDAASGQILGIAERTPGPIRLRPAA